MHYHLIHLANGLETLVTQEPKTDKPSAAMDICVGHLSDPEELQGPAHFFEHLSNHSGGSNAYTSMDSTNFDALQVHFEDALDRSTQFFLGPLFNSPCSEQEIKAVDSEHKKNLYNASKSRTSKALCSTHEAHGDSKMDPHLYTVVVTLDKLTIQETIGGAIKTFEKDAKLEHEAPFGLGQKLDAGPEPALDSLVKQNKHFNDIVTLDLLTQPIIEIGGYNFAKYPELANFKVIANQGWPLEQSTITALGAALSDMIVLMMDSGSSVLMLPASHMKVIMI
ncbi:uncharacterized protein UBRO_20310 [Ustilago bromivora]|uniref:Peptidase M16 N-terminal domain-containing protein n=1 Tax=Ustilago bromivora TaxID=307758 RepID=A0A1K0GUU6_9BASI|nr:uncharacterized protein UBRO_20310 [Ustilago bromivora]